MEEKCPYMEPSLEKQLKGHRNAVTALYFSPNERQIASSSLDNSVLLWDLLGTMRSYRFQGHDEAVLDVTFSPSGKYMASASRDKTVRLWVPTVTGSTGMFKAHSQTVRSVQFNYDGTKIVTGSDDKIVKLWSADKLKFISSFVGHTNWVRSARISSDGSIIASCSDDKSTRLWNPDSGECIYTYKDKKGHGLCLAWHPSSCYIAVGTSQGNVKLYDVRTHSLVQYYNIHNDAVTQVAFHPSGSYILTSSKDNKMKILDLLEGHPIFTLSGHSGGVNAVNFSLSGDSFASAGEDKLVLIWKTNFTELSNETKENLAQNEETPRNASQKSKLSAIKGRTQGMRVWYLCYHSHKYPVTSFANLDDRPTCNDSRHTNFEEPNANSTFIDGRCVVDELSCTNVTENSCRVREQPSCVTDVTENSCRVREQPSCGINVPQTSCRNREQPDCGTDITQNSCRVREQSCGSNVTRNSCRNMSDSEPSCSVGDISHIPRRPPSKTTYTIPTLLDRSATTCNDNDDDLFGMIKLKDDDVCYTSGSIEWVGRKRSYPINSGFKIINDNCGRCNEPSLKRIRRLDKTYSVNSEKIKECDCAEVLPTVNAIVDHLNALHEAIDLVDLRLNTLEDVAGK